MVNVLIVYWGPSLTTLAVVDGLSRNQKSMNKTQKVYWHMHEYFVHVVPRATSAWQEMTNENNAG